MIALALSLALAGPTLTDDLFTLHDPAITESSAVVEVGRGPDHRVLTINDSGDGPVVYVLDPRTGRTVGRSSYDGDAVDVEALAPGLGGEVWVGDIGDNGAVRADVQLYRLPALKDGDREVPSTRYDLVYRGGARDAETLLVQPRTGRVFVVSKSFFGGKVYAAPRDLRADRPNQLVPVGPAPAVVTDGAFFPDGRHVVLRDYSRAYVLDTTRLPWRRVDSFELPDQPQGEGVAVRRGGRSLLVSTEGEAQPVQVVPVPARVLAELEPPTPTSTPQVRDEEQPSRLEALTQDGAVPWTLVGGIVGVCALLGLGFRLRRVRAARRRSRSTR
ncbi:hypothetical protein [Nocardioides marmoribigeumensis]|uniref:Esterase-like activity of phytase family protein n=1 Tax=Nocardioides marmoribigeumensis TaxID=433649 RepID=A0ABU2BZB4_9ACTN|nr:hypothetical protein [Nocardioides marmoribigeumensis]MDR7363717.1 hypothetical protein [Nocardioides marmoribigeumensis]